MRRGGNVGGFHRRSNRGSRDALRLPGNDPLRGWASISNIVGGRSCSLARAGSPAGCIRLRPSGYGGTGRPHESGGPGTRDGPAWVGVAGLIQHHRWKGQRGIPRPQRSVETPACAPGGFSLPWRRRRRRRAGHGLFDPMVPRHPPRLGRSRRYAFAGAGKDRSFPTLATHRPGAVERRARPPSLPERWEEYPSGLRV